MRSKFILINFLLLLLLIPLRARGAGELKFLKSLSKHYPLYNSSWGFVIQNKEQLVSLLNNLIRNGEKAADDLKDNYNLNFENQVVVCISSEKLPPGYRLEIVKTSLVGGYLKVVFKKVYDESGYENSEMSGGLSRPFYIYVTDPQKVDYSVNPLKNKLLGILFYEQGESFPIFIWPQDGLGAK